MPTQRLLIEPFGNSTTGYVVTTQCRDDKAAVRWVRRQIKRNRPIEATMTSPGPLGMISQSKVIVSPPQHASIILYQPDPEQGA